MLHSVPDAEGKDKGDHGPLHRREAAGDSAYRPRAAAVEPHDAQDSNDGQRLDLDAVDGLSLHRHASLLVLQVRPELARDVRGESQGLHAGRARLQEDVHHPGVGEAGHIAKGHSDVLVVPTGGGQEGGQLQVHRNAAQGDEARHREKDQRGEQRSDLHDLVADEDAIQQNRDGQRVHVPEPKAGPELPRTGGLVELEELAPQILSRAPEEPCALRQVRRARRHGVGPAPREILPGLPGTPAVEAPNSTRLCPRLARRAYGASRPRLSRNQRLTSGQIARKGPLQRAQAFAFSLLLSQPTQHLA